jgi:hypothetical protein
MSAPSTTECPGRTGHYVPWSFGESFACSMCGARVHQSHLVGPIAGSDSQAIYPIPAHERKQK